MSESAPIRPEDVLPDGVNATTYAGVDVRKGTIAAFVANAQQLERLSPIGPRRPALEDQLRALAPALRAVGVLDVFTPRSTAIAAILADQEAAE